MIKLDVPLIILRGEMFLEKGWGVMVKWLNQHQKASSFSTSIATVRAMIHELFRCSRGWPRGCAWGPGGSLLVRARARNLGCQTAAVTAVVVF